MFRLKSPDAKLEFSAGCWRVYWRWGETNTPPPSGSTRSKETPFAGIKQLREARSDEISYCTRSERARVIAAAETLDRPDWLAIPLAFYVGWTVFRHTFGSLLAQAGVGLDKVSAWMGNTPEVCRRHYAQFVPRDHRDDEIDKL